MEQEKVSQWDVEVKKGCRDVREQEEHFLWTVNCKQRTDLTMPSPFFSPSFCRPSVQSVQRPWTTKRVECAPSVSRQRSAWRILASVNRKRKQRLRWDTQLWDRQHQEQTDWESQGVFIGLSICLARSREIQVSKFICRHCHPGFSSQTSLLATKAERPSDTQSCSFEKQNKLRSLVNELQPSTDNLQADSYQQLLSSISMCQLKACDHRWGVEP